MTEPPAWMVTLSHDYSGVGNLRVDAMSCQRHMLNLKDSVQSSAEAALGGGYSVPPRILFEYDVNGEKKDTNSMTSKYAVGFLFCDQKMWPIENSRREGAPSGPG